MKKKGLILLLVSIFFLSGCGQDGFFNEASSEIPYYFVVIRNNPHNGDRAADTKIKQEYEQLKKMVARANEYNIKLTLMFPPQWAPYVNEIDLDGWKTDGHEIAAYHQGVHSDKWDGYTDLPTEIVLEERHKRTAKVEPFQGGMDVFWNKVSQLNSEIVSGCINEEFDKKEEFQGVIYDTCSGFANFGEVGRVVDDSESPLKGINEYVSTKEQAGVSRKWLAHYQVDDLKNEKKAEETFLKMRKGVFGSVNSSLFIEANSFFVWIDFLHLRDREGIKSRTVSQVIEQKILPEKELP